MRVLICSHPGLGHFLPFVPLAWAFRTEGHEVLVSIADCAERAAESGLEIVDVAPDFDMDAINEQVAKDHPDLVAAMATTPMVELEFWAAGLAAVNRPLVPGNIALADDWRPDLVLYDQVNTVGLLVADRCGVPAVQYNMGSVPTDRTHQAVAGHLADLCSRYGVTVSAPALSLEMNPPSLLNRPPEGQFMRWVPYNGGAVFPGRLPAPRDGRPRVAVSMGTTTLEMFGLGSLASVVDAAAGVDADFALAVGDADLEPLGKLPPNVRQVGWVPLATLLRTCTALIHHGGGGSMLNAVAADVPQLIAHDPADLIHHIDFAVVRERGIGLVAPSDQVDAAMMKALLADEGLRHATREVHNENLSLPSPAATARSILELVARHPRHRGPTDGGGGADRTMYAERPVLSS